MNRVPRSSYLLGATVFGSAVLGLGLSIALPFFLPPQEYARFSLDLALTQFVTSIAFEWIRMSVVRHAGGDGPDRAGLHRNLRSLYTIVIGLLAIVAAVLGLLATSFPILLAPSLVCATAATQGLFDGRSAWARAQFHNVSLSLAQITRPALSLVMILLIAIETRSGTWAIFGLCLSYPIAALVFRDPWSSWRQSIQLDRETALSLLKFGSMAAIGTNISLAVPAALRSIIVSTLGLSGAGGTLLALDIAQRAFATTGMALNLVHLQTLIRQVDTLPRDEAIRKARNSVGFEAILYLGATAVLASAALPIAQIIAPHRYQHDFAANFPAFCLLMAIITLRQYAIDTLFIVFRKVAVIAVAPAVTLALFGLSFLAVTTRSASAEHLPALLLAAALVGFVIPFLFMRRMMPGITPISLLAAGVVAALAGVALAAPLPDQRPVLALILKSGASLLAYAAVLAIILGPWLLIARSRRRSAAEA